MNPAVGELWPVAQLRPDPHPIREHPELQIKALALSLERFGQQKPLVITADGEVLAGNGTLAAAQRLGWPAIACRVFTGSRDEARAFRLADNRAGELSEWDEGNLAQLLPGLTDADRAALGFTDDELQLLTQGGRDWQPPAINPGMTGLLPSLRFTGAQWDVIGPVLRELKRQAGEGLPMTDGRALELLCADWLAGPRRLPA